MVHSSHAQSTAAVADDSSVGSQGSKLSSTSGSVHQSISSPDLPTAEAPPPPSSNGFVSVGKISFNLKDVIGKGCEGTFVYR